MFLSNPAKSFLASFLILLSVAGCGWLKTGENTAGPTVPEPKSRLPFKTKEPENFQCEIVETAGGVQRRMRLARKGNWRRIDYDLGEKNQKAVLKTDKEYLIDLGRNSYAEKPVLAGNTAAPQFSDLTHELLTAGQRVEFEELDREGSIVKYKALDDNAETGEIIIHYDENIGMPVKQEFFTINGGERVLEFSIELVNFKTEPDKDLFTIPTGYSRVSTDEFYSR